MCRTDVLPISDEEKRLATAYYRFINNTGDSKRMLFHLIGGNSQFAISGAGYGGWTTNLTWQLEGSQPWNYRLFGWGSSPYGLSGRDAPNANALFNGTGVNAQSWGGFRNLNSSSNLVNYNYTPGPFSQVNCQNSNWGYFGAHNGISVENSLMGGSGSAYYLQPDPERYNIVIPSTALPFEYEPEEIYSLTEDSLSS